MRIKCIEIRDEGTCIAAIAIAMKPSSHVESAFLWREGYPPHGVVLMRLSDQRATSDAYEWNDRTHQTAHLYIEQHFDELENGTVVDVRVILEETEEPAEAEVYTK